MKTSFCEITQNSLQNENSLFLKTKEARLVPISSLKKLEFIIIARLYPVSIRINDCSDQRIQNLCAFEASQTIWRLTVQSIIWEIFFIKSDYPTRLQGHTFLFLFNTFIYFHKLQNNTKNSFSSNQHFLAIKICPSDNQFGRLFYFSFFFSFLSNILRSGLTH